MSRKEVGAMPEAKVGDAVEGDSRTGLSGSGAWHGRGRDTGVGGAGLAFWRVALACFAVVVLGVALFSGRTHIQLVTDWYASNAGWLILLAGAAMLVACALLHRAETSGADWFDRYFPLVVAILSALLLTYEAQVARNCEFYTTWDPNAFVEYLSGDAGAATLDYFETYGNQFFLLWVFSGVKALCETVGFSNWHLGLTYGAALIACLCTALGAFVVRELTGSWVWGLFGWSVCAVLVGCSPWLLVPYSDSYGVLAPTVVLFAYVCVRNPWAKAGLVGFFSFVGYFVKPTSLAILGAIALVEGVHLARRARGARCDLRGDGMAAGSLAVPAGSPTPSAAAPEAPADRRATTRPALRLASVLVVGVVGVACACALGAAAAHVTPHGDPQRAFSWQHYLMMGTNPDNGMYDADDNTFSASFDTAESRNAADLAEFRRRVGEMGPVGLLRHWADKTVVNFDDGAFGWDREGNPPTRVEGRDPGLLRFYEVKPYGPQDGGPWRTSVQVVWFAVLLGLVAGLCDREPRRELVATLVAVVLLAIFLMVFECRARYLYLYLPCFVTLGACGWHALAGRAARALGGEATTDPRPERA